jgi:nucleolar pre-ribosomal-associated protein 1
MFMTFGNQYHRNFEDIFSLYSRILLNGFLHWKSFVSGNIFEEEFGELLSSSTHQFLSIVDNTLLGKYILMLQYHFAFSGVSMKMKKRLKLFDKIFPRFNAHAELLDCDVGDMDSHSLNQLLNHINRVVANISFCRILLFMENNQITPLPKETKGDLKEVSLEIGSNSESSRMQFMNILVSIWQWIIKKLSLVSDSSAKEKRTDSSSLYKHLGDFILKSTFELTAEMHDGLVQLQYVPFLEELMRRLFYIDLRIPQL